MRFRAYKLALVGYSPPFSSNTLRIQPLFILTPRSNPGALAIFCGMLMFSEQRRNVEAYLPTTNFEFPLLSPSRLHLASVNRQSKHSPNSNPLTLPNLNSAGFRPVQPSQLRERANASMCRAFQGPPLQDPRIQLLIHTWEGTPPPLLNKHHSYPKQTINIGLSHF